MSKYTKHLIIVGTARSGTSWLSELIAQQHRYRILFEPEQETRTKKGYLLCDKWFENRADAGKMADDYLKKIFANRVDSDWIGQASNRSFKRHLWPFVPKKYIIKFVRANLSAKYMNDAFQIPVIHIIRNPYDVLQSQLRSNFPWLTDLSHFAKQENLVNLVKENFGFDISDPSPFSKLELLTIRWCIENVLPLEVMELYQNNSAVIKYEDLRENIQVFYELCEKFDIKPVDNIVDIYNKPSSKTHSKSSLVTKEKQKFEWNKEQLREVNGILKMFKTSLYPLKS